MASTLVTSNAVHTRDSKSKKRKWIRREPRFCTTKSSAASARTMPPIRAGLTPRSSTALLSSRSAIGTTLRRRCPLPAAQGLSGGWRRSRQRGAIHEAIAHPWLRDEARGARVVAKLLPHLAGVHPEILRLAAVFRPPHLLQDRAMGEHPSGVPSEQRQKRELLGREVDVVVADGHPVVGHVDHQVTDA